MQAHERPILLSDLLQEDQVVFFIGNEDKPSIMEILGRRFQDLNFDHLMNALWFSEHQGADSIAPGVRTFWGKLSEISDVKVAIGISKQAVRGLDATERLYLLFLEPYGNRFRNRALVRKASSLFQKPNLITQLSKLWSPTEVVETLRAAELKLSPPQGLMLTAP